MQSDSSIPPDRDPAPPPKYESRPIPVLRIAAIVGAIALMTLACLGIVSGLMTQFSRSRPKEPGTLMAPIVPKDSAPLQRFPGPQLQVIPRKDLLALRTKEDAELTTYGWINSTTGVVRLPIDRAMDLCAARLGSASNTFGKSELELIRERPERR